MTTPGMFQQELVPNYSRIYNTSNYMYIQREVGRRLLHKYKRYNEVTLELARDKLQTVHDYWRGPLNIHELLEHTIRQLVGEIDTEIAQHTQFDHMDPSILYHPESGITREEKHKLRTLPAFEFQMNY